MEITGYDNVIFTCVDPRPPLLEVVEALRVRWGTLIATVDSPDEGINCVRTSLAGLVDRSGSIIIVRDKEMNLFMEQHAFALMKDGEGPLMLMYRTRGPISFRLPNLTEIVREPNRNIDPYDAWLCSPIVFEITVVTPASPANDAFSEWVVERVKQACLRKSEHSFKHAERME